VINRYVNKYFNCFPSEIINVINYHYITIYGHIDKLPFTCDIPGKYWITKDWDFYDISYTIDIISDNVHIDLQGYTITNHNSYMTIYIKNGVNTYIENGILRSLTRPTYDGMTGEIGPPLVTRELVIKLNI
jgi:hypothetical protein